MNLKPFIVSMCALGMTGFAVAASPAVNGNVSDMEAMKAKIAKMESVLDQNQGQVYSFGDLPLKSWSDRVTLRGLVNVDAAFSNQTPNLTAAAATSRFGVAGVSNSSSQLAVANANLFADAEVNCYTTAHVALNYWGNARTFNDQPSVIARQALNIDEAYATISNFSQTPVYFRGGLQYVDFGTYNRFEITAPLTQLLSQTRASAATLGFNDAGGFNGSVYLFNGTNNAANASRAIINNGGVHLGYNASLNNVSYGFAADYLNSMADVNTVQQSFTGVATTYVKRVGGLSLHGGMRYGQFDGSLDYVSALTSFDTADWVHNAVAAKPSAFGIDLGWSFDSAGLPSRFGVGYQNSRQADTLGTGNVTYAGLPKSRWLAQYGLELGRNTDVTFQVVRDSDYATTSGGTGKSLTKGVVRLGVRFA